MSRIALIAGQGRLPVLLSRALAGQDAVMAEMEGFPAGIDADERFRFERLAEFFDRLHMLDVDRVVFAGRIHRPRLDPARLDARTMLLVPRVMAAMGRGDDGLLREMLAIFEENGFAVIGADAVAPDLVPGEGVLTHAQPSATDHHDATRAAAIVAAIGALDVGQGAVVAGGQCLALEALPGTDAMLDALAFVLPAQKHGILYKAPKPGQERRIDLPALGPETVQRAASAGLSGIAFEAGGVLLIDRDQMVAEADRAGIALWGRAP